ncbi:hypothetical protein [Myroides sp. N17-2]|uniref:hypothetical protein n=1 Tax=Myroides sp. N17-2 TaxID=2030799 RepID=UPI000EFDA631|nr:hypothetical protein [Myroides sp. N17-2]
MFLLLYKTKVKAVLVYGLTSILPMIYYRIEAAGIESEQLTVFLCYVGTVAVVSLLFRKAFKRIDIGKKSKLGSIL